MCAAIILTNIFDNVLFFSQQIISISRKLWEYKYTKIFHKCTSCRSLRFGNAVPKFWRMRLSLLVGHSDLKTLVLSLMRMGTCVSHSDLELSILLLAWRMRLSACVSHLDLELIVLLIAWLIKQSRIYESSRLIKLSASLTH